MSRARHSLPPQLGSAAGPTWPLARSEGRDYHLAIIDPKSRAIKIKLLEFSGAGVGSGGDKEWAANLQHQAIDSRARLQNEVAKLLQPERLAQLLGEEPDDQISGILKSYMEKYYDQVIQKEMVAAELDCEYAEKAIQDLIGLERDNELLSLNGVDASGEIIPIVDDLEGKIAKLVKIGENCNKSYSISGVSNGVSYSGEICNLDKPFILNGTFANGSETQSFNLTEFSSSVVEAEAMGVSSVLIAEQGKVLFSAQVSRGTAVFASDASSVIEAIDRFAKAPRPPVTLAAEQVFDRGLSELLGWVRR